MAERVNELSACEALARIARGELTAEALTRACLERIGEREAVVRAFVWLDPEQVLAQARELDRSFWRGPLHGLPVAVKDLFETADMPTACGSPIYAGHRPACDAAAVALAREAGALILGKTVTTEFALRAPGPTTNPWHPGHTPGGSSSGSAAAVADRMVPVALGTQTGGSIIRPASYCGIVGYKPSLGTINRTGVKPLAESFDTVGVLARTVEDAGMVAAVLAGEPAERRAIAPLRPARAGLCRTPAWSEAEPATVAAVAAAAAALAGKGVAVEEIGLPGAFDHAIEAQSLMLRFEAFRTFAFERTRHADRLAPGSLAELEVGSRIGRAAYLEAKAVLRACRQHMAEVFRRVDLLLTASAPGEPPAGLSSTGEATFNRLWTGLLLPCLNIPAERGPGGLPVGVQTVGARDDDHRLLRWSRWIEAQLDRAYGSEPQGR